MKVEQVTTAAELHEVWHLVYQGFLRMGYCLPRHDEEIDEHHELDLTEDGELYSPTTVFFVRNENETMVGTVSVTRDGSEGLHTDGTYWKTTNGMRDLARYEGGEIASIWRIVISQSTGFTVLKALFDEVVAWVNQWLPRYVLCTFNPRQEHFYERICGMEKIDSAVAEQGLHNAPSVLMLWRPEHYNDWTKKMTDRHRQGQEAS